MKSLIVFLLLFGFVCISSIKAQNSSEAEEVLLAKCREFSAYPDSLKKFGRILLQSEDSLYKAEGDFVLGLAEYRNQHLHEAAVHYINALRKLDQKEHYKTFMRVLSNLAIVNYRLENFEVGDSLTNVQLNLAKASNDSSQIAGAYNMLSIVQKDKGNLNHAIQFAEKALKFYDEQSPSRINVFTNIGIINVAMGNNREATLWFLKAYNRAQELDIVPLIARSTGNLSKVYADREIADSSLYFSKLALEYNSETGNTMGILSSLNKIALSYIALEEYQKAEVFADSTLSLFKQNNSSGRIEADYLITKARLRSHAGAYNEALIYVDSAFTTLDSVSNTERWLAFLFLKSNILESIGRTGEAFQIYKTADKLQGELKKSRDAEKVKQVVANYELIEKDKVIFNLKQSSEEWKRRSIYAFSGGVFLLLGLYFVYRKYNEARSSILMQNKEIEEMRDSIEKIQLERPLNKKDNRKILLKSKALVDVSDIMFIKSDGHYLDIYLESRMKSEVERDSLKNIQTKLPANFIQIHRSYIINTDFIRSVFASKIILKNGRELPLSRKYKSELKEM